MFTPDQRQRFEELLAARGLGRGGVDWVRARTERKAPVRLSSAQQRLWFTQQLHRHNTAYNVVVAVRMEGLLDVAALQEAVGDLVARHEILRTRFFALNGVPFQVAADRVDTPVELHAAGPLPAKDRIPYIQTFGTAFGQQCIPLETGPVFRAAIVEFDRADYALVLLTHHICIDQWSIDLILRELAVLYTARVQGRVPELPPLPFQYADYSAWERKRFEAEVDAMRQVWKARLEGVPPRLDLPTDHPHAPAGDFTGGEHRFTVEGPLLDALRALAEQRGVTLSMTVMTLWGTLLSRYCSQQDLVFFTTTAFRGEPDTEAVAGCFINVLPIRFDVRDDPPFAEALARIREVALEAFDHSQIPFEVIARILAPETEGTRLLQAYYQYQPASMTRLVRIPGIRQTAVRVHNGRAKFDLLLNVSDRGGSLDCVIEYHAGLFEVGTIRRIHTHLERLLVGATADPLTPVSRLPLSPIAERTTLLAWSRSPQPVPRHSCIARYLATQASRTPRALAVVDGTRRITYAELDRWADRIAAGLLAFSGRRARVGVCLPRSARMVAALMGVVKTGAAYVPTEPAHPVAWKRELFRRAEVDTVITDADGARELAGPSLTTLDAGRLLARGTAHVSVADVSLEAPAYLLSTSGSTGTPRVVEVPQRGVTHLIEWARSTFDPSELRGVLASTSLCFDLSVFEILGTLALGGTVVLARSALELPGLVAASEVTLVNTVPSVMRELLRVGIPDSVVVANLAGEALPRELVADVFRRTNVRRVLNLYGPTETTVYSTCAEMDSEAGGEPTIGRPIAGDTAYVLDAHLELSPMGVPGELCIGGPGVAHGYVGDEAATRERFVADPLGRASERLFRTGDLACWLDTGELRFLGRRDGHFKVRGHRVDPLLVEASLRQACGVADAAVVPQDFGAGDVQLVAYVVPLDPSRFDEASVRAALSGVLPNYLHPSRYVVLERLPRLTSGKVDRRSLPRQIGSVPEDGTPGPADADGRMARIWRSVLGIAVAEAEGDFFRLGGHSLLVLRLLAAVREAFGVAVSPAEFLNASSLGAFSALVRSRWPRNDGPGLDGGGAISVSLQGEHPVTLQQHSLWQLDTVLGSADAFSVPCAFRVRGHVSRSRLVAGLYALIERHAALRTTFRMRDGEVFQYVAEADLGAVTVCVAHGAGAEAVRRKVSGWMSHHFDLGAGPLFRALVLETGPGEFVLTLHVHHIVVDEWSLSLLLKELSSLCCDDARPPESLARQYVEYARWQRGDGGTETFRCQLAYWRGVLRVLPPPLSFTAEGHAAGVSPLCLPGVHTVDVPAHVAARTRATAAETASTPFVVLLAAFQLLLRSLTGADAFTIGTVVANRSLPGTEGIVGLFLNTVLLPCELGAGATFPGIVEVTRRRLSEALTHQDLPFEIVALDAEHQFGIQRRDLFSALIVMQETIPPKETGTSVVIEECASEEIGTDLVPSPISCPLVLLVSARGDSYRLSFRYDRDVFATAAAENAAARFIEMLDGDFTETRP